MLNEELSATCCALHYTEAPDGMWWASYEADRMNTDASSDITALLAAIDALSDMAKEQLWRCSIRDFNIGFHCWDSWAYNHAIPGSVVAGVARANCSISITLYPMREADGTPKIDPDDE